MNTLSSLLKFIANYITKNTIEGATYITSYTESNPFVVPSDGYVIASNGAAANSIAIARVIGTQTAALTFGGFSNSTYANIPIFVRKGMKVATIRAGNDGNVIFVPIN